MPTVPERISELIRNGRKIEAIKLLREETGVDLKTAKETVDKLEADPAFDPVSLDDATPEIGSEISEAVRTLAWQGLQIHAIKLFREQSGLGLKESKEAVDLLPRNPELPAPNAGPGMVAILVVILVAALLLVLGAALAFFVGAGS